MEPGNDSTEKKKKMKNPKRDRISNLPEPVLHHILSFLHMKHVVQTSILSKKWRYVWKSVPFLNIGCDLFHSIKTKRFEKSRNLKKGECFKHFVDQVLLLRCSNNIQSFRLSSIHLADYLRGHSNDCGIENHLDSWISTVLSRNVEELFLEITANREYRLPNYLFTCESLTVLELLELRISPPDSMSLPNLKTLIFEDVKFVGSDIFTKIFAGCPVLESFYIMNCRFDQKNMEFYALNLKHLIIKSDYDHPCETKIKLYAPNLISFLCRGCMSKDYCIENLSSLVEADIDMDDESGEETRAYVQHVIKTLTAFRNVKELTLSPNFLKVVNWTGALQGMLLQFCNLRSLKVVTWLFGDYINVITKLLSISPNIESLFVEIVELSRHNLLPTYPYWDEVRVNLTEVQRVWQEVVPLQCMLVHLRIVEIRGAQGRLSELWFLEILLKNAMVLEKLVLHTSNEQSPDTKNRLVKFIEKLLSLPRASSSIVILLL